MKRLIFALLCLVLLLPFNTAFAVQPTKPNVPTVFIAASDGFDTDLTAAIEKKKTPLIVVEDKTKADYILQVAPVFSHDETTGGKIARCLFLDCIGMNGSSAVSVKLLRTSDSAVVWAYQVRKSFSGPIDLLDQKSLAET